MQLRWSLLNLALPAITHATAINPRNLGADFLSPECLLIKIVIEVLHSPQASEFCESFLAPTTITTITVTETSSSCAYTYAAAQTQTNAAPQVTSAPDRRNATPSVLQGLPSSKVSEACSCLDIPSSDLTTRTHTQTATSTTTFCPIPTACGNDGMQWAYYQPGSIPYDASCDPPYNWDPTGIKDMTPSYNSRTTYIGLSGDGKSDISIYGSSRQFFPQFFALNHRGYIYAEVSGDYTFNTSLPDDINFFWHGPDAFSGWTESNTNITTYCSGTTTVTMPLLSGQYYPIRFIYANAQGALVERMSITAPDGTDILGSNTTSSPYIVQYSCDGTSAPPYPLFGQET